MITFTRDIERFEAKPNKTFEVVIGPVKGTWGLGIKVVTTETEVHHAMDLVSQTSGKIYGKIYAGFYKNRKFHSMAFRTNAKDKKWYFYRLQTTEVRMAVKENNEKRD